MIPVRPQPEPHDFAATVRVPGQLFLRRIANPTNREYRDENAQYWRNCSGDLYRSYGGICAYSGQKIPRGRRRRRVVDSPSLDHFIPKSKCSKLAYEWSNYRLARAKINKHKEDSLDVIDPFCIKADWFIIDFATYFIKPNDGLPEYLETRINDTITQLKLNDDVDLIRERTSIVSDYRAGIFSIGFLERNYPFIAYEIRRQGI